MAESKKFKEEMYNDDLSKIEPPLPTAESSDYLSQIECRLVPMWLAFRTACLGMKFFCSLMSPNEMGLQDDSETVD